MENEEVDMDTRAKLSRIDLVFENCEFCSIPREAIRFLHLDKINSSINYSEWNGLHSFKSTSIECLEIKKEFLEKSCSYMANEEFPNEQENLLERIQHYNDIVSIEIYWVLNNVEYVRKYFVIWDDEDDYHNDYQKSQIITTEDSQEVLQISIKKENKVNETLGE